MSENNGRAADAALVRRALRRAAEELEQADLSAAEVAQLVGAVCAAARALAALEKGAAPWPAPGDWQGLLQELRAQARAA